MKSQMRIASLPIRFLTPFPQRFSRRLRNSQKQILLSDFSERAQTSSPPLKLGALEKHFAKAKPSTVASSIRHLSWEKSRKGTIFLCSAASGLAPRHPFSLRFFGRTVVVKKAICSMVATAIRYLLYPGFVSFLMISPVAGQQQEWDGNRTTPVHLIPLKDELDQPIIPTESYPLPFSSRYTCAPCHDYEIVSRGLHFKAAQPPHPGRPGEPWVWVDETTGTLLPLSYRKMKGVWGPAQVGLTAWDFTLLFGRHLAGGGISEPADTEFTPGSRWEVAGKIEINCLGCHNAAAAQDTSEWAKQILRENFRWAATAASGLGEVGGMASRVHGTWDIYDGPDPDDTEWAVPPFVRYNPSFFDSRHRVLFDLVHKPADDRCLTCHSVAPIGQAKYAFDEDVHTAAGLKCVDCHRNDLRHAMVRGYEGEADDDPGMEDEEFTCAGCHLGNESAKGEKALSGRLGAPYPKHNGLPAVHFERLSCTVCHSGPWPEKELTRVRTSRANRLGIYGVARWSTDLPAVLEPVYIRERNGKLAPNRMLWPAFWAERKGDAFIPLKPEAVLTAAGDLLRPEQGVANILTALSLDLEAGQVAVLIYQGKVFELNVDGRLSVSPYAGEIPSSGPVWAVKKDDDIVPLVPEFDPESEDSDPDVEAKIQTILEALAGSVGARGKPVLLFKGAIYQITETYLEKIENPGEPAAFPTLAWIVDEKVEPLVSEFELRTFAMIVGLEQILTEEQVKVILEALAQTASPVEAGEKGEYVYISGGKLFRIAKSGGLEAVDNDAAAPATWPLAHEVRPARQSLGINGCKDCHRFGSPFLFRKAKGTGPLLTNRVRAISANAFMGLDRPYQKLFGLSFAVRPLLKGILLISAIVIALILGLVVFLFLGRASGLIEKKE
jgi:hypothetical protein